MINRVTPYPNGAQPSASDQQELPLPDGAKKPVLKLLLTAPEAAEALNICQKTLWTHSKPRGTIPVVRIGARVLYDRRDLERWIDAQKVAD